LIDTIIRRMERDETMSTLLAASGAAWHALALLAADRRAVGRDAVDPIEATIEHLRAAASTISSIAQQVCYPDPLYFSRQFRRIHAMSSSEYRSRDAG
jgi:AraC family transcriptional regulator of arabinose operon